ncbi:MAG: cupredoxin domain-containing protein [Candidatus Acidiferrum sp.]|jgi:cytochrome c oxidase subunit 2
MKWIALIVTFGFSLSLFANPSGSGKSPAARTIDISAHRFAFEPNEITIKKGEKVTLIIHSADVSHGLVIEDLGVRVEVKKGETASVNLDPAAAGTFDGKCAHFCGKGHGLMKLSVHVIE